MKKYVELANLAVSQPTWRWLRGCESLPGTLQAWSSICRGRIDHDNWMSQKVLPDLSSPATLGCLHKLVKSACRLRSFEYDGYIEFRRNNSLVFVVCFSRSETGELKENFVSHGQDEAEALVNALVYFNE